MGKSRAGTDDLMRRLVADRGDMSLIDTDIAAASDVAFSYCDWVRAWVDQGHEVRSDLHGATAYRAISDEGRFMWLVMRDGKERGFHSTRGTAYEAIRDATAHADKRREVRQNWTSVKALCRRVRAGRLNFEVEIADAHRGGLCELGVSGFMKRFGLARVQKMSARKAAYLILLDKQVGHAIYAAALRHGLLEPVPAPVAVDAAVA